MSVSPLPTSVKPTPLQHLSLRDCVTPTLEGPGITQSQCPTCRMPVWKKDLRKNCTYEKAIEALKAAARLLESTKVDPSLGSRSGSEGRDPVQPSGLCSPSGQGFATLDNGVDTDHDDMMISCRRGIAESGDEHCALGPKSHRGGHDCDGIDPRLDGGAEALGPHVPAPHLPEPYLLDPHSQGADLSRREVEPYAKLQHVIARYLPPALVSAEWTDVVAAGGVLGASHIQKEGEKAALLDPMDLLDLLDLPAPEAEEVTRLREDLRELEGWLDTARRTSRGVGGRRSVPDQPMDLADQDPGPKPASSDPPRTAFGDLVGTLATESRGAPLSVQPDDADISRRPPGNLLPSSSTGRTGPLPDCRPTGANRDAPVSCSLGPQHPAIPELDRGARSAPEGGTSNEVLPGSPPVRFITHPIPLRGVATSLGNVGDPALVDPLDLIDLVSAEKRPSSAKRRREDNAAEAALSDMHPREVLTGGRQEHRHQACPEAQVDLVDLVDLDPGIGQVPQPNEDVTGVARERRRRPLSPPCELRPLEIFAGVTEAVETVKPSVCDHIGNSVGSLHAKPRKTGNGPPFSAPPSATLSAPPAHIHPPPSVSPRKAFDLTIVATTLSDIDRSRLKRVVKHLGRARIQREVNE